MIPGDCPFLFFPLELTKWIFTLQVADFFLSEKLAYDKIATNLTRSWLFKILFPFWVIEELTYMLAKFRLSEDFHNAHN